jgi:hypothetical protein
MSRKPAPPKTVVNPPRGEKSGFIKIAISLSPETYKLAGDEALRRKVAQEPNAQVSAVIRECIAAHLGATKRSR